MNVTPFVLMSTEKLSELIKSVREQKVSLESAVQSAAIQCIAFSIKHRNSTPADQLFQALKGSIRRDALVRYFEKYGNLAYMSKTKDRPEHLTFFEATLDEKHELVAKEIVPAGKLAEFTDKLANYLTSKLWYEQTAEKKVVSVYDAEAMTSDFFKKLRRIQSDNGVTVKHEDLVERLYATYAAWVSEDALKRAKAMTESEQKKIVVAAQDAAHGTVTPEEAAQLFGGKATIKAA